MAQNSAVGGTWPVLELTRAEWRIGRRTPSFRLMVLIAFLVGWTVGGTAGHGVALSANATADSACEYLGFFAIVWMSLTAVRETTLRTHILIFSKPQPMERLALAKFLGAFFQLLVILLGLFLGSICARLLTGNGMTGAEVYVTEYLRAAGVLFFAACASYTIALLFESPIAGALVGLYWILTLAGKTFLGKFYFPAYSQNLPAYIALGLALLCITLQLYQRHRRGLSQPALWIRIGAPACLIVSGLLFWNGIQNSHDPQTHINPILERMGEQDTDKGIRAPGFLLPDQNGKLTGLSDYKGKILVIALWSPHDPDSVLILDRLNDLQAKYGARGVQPLAITLSEDNGTAFTYARGESLNYPVVTDWGTNSAQNKADLSPIANAYRASTLPWLVITDRRRRIREILFGNISYDAGTLDHLVEERLQEEPR